MSEELKDKLTQTVVGDVATIAVIIRKGGILLGLRDYVDGPTVWTSPGGSVADGETLEQATRREVREETGIDDLEFTAYIGNVDAEDRDFLHIFHCKTRQDPERAEPDKFREWIWYPLEDFAAGRLENYISESARTRIVGYFQENDML